MHYLRAGHRITFTVENISGLPNYNPAAFIEFQQALAIDLSGGDTISFSLINVTENPDSTLNLTLRCTLPFDAKPGLRDLLIGNNQNNTPPTIFPDAVTVLPAGKVGSQIWFFTARAVNAQLGDGAYEYLRPSSYGLDITDTFDELLPNRKRMVYDAIESTNTVTPRIYTWDCIADPNKVTPGADPWITGVTAGQLGPNNWADLNKGDPETGPKEGEVLGYIDKKDDGTWVGPTEFMRNRSDAYQLQNLPYVWQQGGAAAAAFDEFQNGEYNIAPLGSTGAGQRTTNNAGPNYTCYRGVMGFPKISPGNSYNKDYRDGDPTFHNASKRIPGHFHHRKPYFYIGTAHHFYSREMLSNLENQRLNALWAGGLYPTMSPGDYYTSYLTQVLQFIGLPLYYRTQNNATTSADWVAAQAAVPQTFEPFNDLLHANNRVYNKAGLESTVQSVVFITIDPVEVVLPGGRWGGGLTNEATYRRNIDAYTKESKIKVWYQDLWPYDDLDYQTGFGNVLTQPYKLAEPVLLMEAYCPRMDMKWDWNEWANLNFPVPGRESGGPDNTGLYPLLTLETQPFEWTLVCESVEQALSTAGTRGGVQGTYDTDGVGPLNAAQSLFNEFLGYKCKLVINRSYWTKAQLNAPDPVSTDILKPGGFSTRDPSTPPYWNDYWTPYEGREGGFFCPSGYLEVVDDD